MRVKKGDLKPLLTLLERVEVPMNYDRSRVQDKEKKHGSKTPAGKGRSVLIGKIPRRYDVSNFTKQHPDIYEEVKRLASLYCPFPVQSFMLNKNYQTQPHYDSKNNKESMIFSFGDYEGGDLIVEGKPVKTKYTTHIMDGANQLHWNDPITSGTKYSLIFFNA